MKRIIIFLTLSIGIYFQMYSQENSKTFYEKMKVMTSELDSTKFVNNILYDRVFPLANLKEFNQGERKDTSNVRHFLQALHELKLASNNHPSILSSDEIKNLNLSEMENNNHIIGILNIDFTQFKSDAFNDSDRKLSIDSTSQFKRILEIQGKDPYQNKQCLVISTLQSTINKSQVNFIFDKALIQRTTNKIKDLFIDFGDGQIHSVISNFQFINKEITFNFLSSGIKTITYFGNFSNGNSFRTYSNVYIDTSITTEIPPIYKFRVDETFTSYYQDLFILAQPQEILFLDSRAEIEFSIYYATNNNTKKLKKPIIITDGIDYGDVRKCPKIFNETLKLSDTGENFGNRLRNQGYDVVIVNFPTTKMSTYTKERIEWAGPGWNPWSGTPLFWNTGIIDTITVFREGGNDYIQRNAKGIKQLLKMVNDSLQTNNSIEKLVLVGPSMGGLVTRWALKELENEGYNHNTRLWVSFDSPHQGANIPMGIQFLAQYSNDYESLKKLQAPAPRQMLVHHYLSEENNTVYQGAPGFRERFKNELLNMGYPNPTNETTKVRKIALVNGTSTGISENTPGARIINIHSWMASFPWGNVLDGDIYFTNNSGNYKVFNFDYSNSAENAGYEDWNKWVNTYANIGSYDTAPGCKFSIDLTPAPDDDFWDWEFAGPFNMIRVDKSYTQYFNHFTFMPTKSTLDFQGNTLLREKLCERNLVLTGETPFDAYYAPNTNEEHVALNTANVQWLLNELNGVTDQQPNLCIPVFEIIGSPTICRYVEQTYHLSSPYFQNVTWDTSDNMSLTVVNNHTIKVLLFTYTPGTSIWITASTPAPNSHFDVMSLSFCNTTIPFDVEYTDGLSLSLSLIDKPNETPLDELGITNVVWELTSGDGQIVEAFDRNAVISGTTFTGRVTVYNEQTSATKTFFWPDPDTCKAIFKTGFDEYKVVDRCNDNQILDVLPIKELYSAYGYKLGDLPIIDQELKIELGNSGDIQIIRVVIDGENLTKRIIKD